MHTQTYVLDWLRRRQQAAPASNRKYALMRSRPAVAFWMASALCIAVGLAASALFVEGVNASGIALALRVTARWSFLLFWLAYSGGALTSLFGPTFEPLKRRAREYGLAFASAHLVHLGLVGWLCLIGAAPPADAFVFFGIAAMWVYLLALFSIDRLRMALSPLAWRLLRLVGMNFVAYAFAKDFLGGPLGGGVVHVVEYLPFAALAIAGPGLRLVAWLLDVGTKATTKMSASFRRPAS